MIEPKPPNLYLVRVINLRHWGVPVDQRKVWAFTAEDAVAQVTLEIKSSDPGGFRVNYVGPVNPECVCLNECRCGVSAPDGGPRKVNGPGD